MSAMLAGQHKTHDNAHYPPRYNAETEAAIEEARNIMAGIVYAKTYATVAEMNADIDLMPDKV